MYVYYVDKRQMSLSCYVDNTALFISDWYGIGRKYGK